MRKLFCAAFILFAANAAHAAVGGINFPIQFLTVQDEGITLSNRVSTLNFVGSAINCTVNGGTVTCTITASAGGGGSGNFRLLLNGVDTGINISSANIVPGNGLGVGVFDSSFTLSIPSTASISVSTLQATNVYQNGNAVLDVSASSQIKTGSLALGGGSFSGTKLRVHGFNTSGSIFQDKTTALFYPDATATSVFGIGFTELTNADIQLKAGGNGSRKLIFAVGNSPSPAGNLAIHTNGNVGVNTSTPAYGLEVASFAAIIAYPGYSGTILFIGTATPGTGSIASGLYYIGATSMSVMVSTVFFGSANNIWASSTFTLSNVKLAFPNALPGSNGLCIAGNTDGVLYFTACGSGGGGSALTIGGYAGNAFKVAASTINASGDIAVQTEGSSFTFRVDLSTLSASTNTILNNFNASTTAITNFINSIASEAVSGGGGGVKSLYLTATLDSSLSNTYSLMFTTPSTGSEKTLAASVAAADGLVSVSSHVTIVTGLGQGVNKIPAGFWQFTIFAKEDSLVGQTDLIVDVSTISRTGTNKFKILSATISNINSTILQIYDAETILTSDVFISTDDRILMQMYAKATSALARTITVAYEGTSHASRIGTSIERNPTFIALDDTPSTYIGSAGKIPQVNSTETGLQFITIPDVSGTTTTRLNNLDASTATTTTALKSTGTALTNLTNAVVTSTQNIANSTGVVVNGTLISSFVFTGAGQSTSFNGGTVTVTIAGGAGGGGGGSMTFQQGQGGTWIAQSSMAVLPPLQFDPLGSSSGTLTLPTTAQVTISTLTATVVKISSPLFTTSGGTGLSTTYHRRSFFIPAGYWATTKSSGTSLFSSSETVTNLVPFDQMMFVNRSTTYAYAPWMMPNDWDTTNSTLTFKFVGLASSGTVGNTSTMTLSCETFRYRDAIDTALGSAAGTSVDFSSASHVLISSESAPMTCAGTPTGDSFATFKLGRLGSDSLDAFLQLLGVRIYYNSKSWTE